MKYRCVVVEDEYLLRVQIETYLSQLPNYEVIASSSCEVEARVILQNETIDLLFLDIEMSVLIGIDFFKKLFNAPKVIFTTKQIECSCLNNELKAIDCVLIPFRFERFFKSILKFLNDEP